MALTFSEGSIGGDIERVNVGQLQAFYGNGPVRITEMRSGTEFGRAALRADSLRAVEDAEEKSHRVRTAWRSHPKNTTKGHALLLINPHTSFFFRSELADDERRRAPRLRRRRRGDSSSSIRASTSTWAGCTRRARVDATDEYLETVSEKDGQFFYKFGDTERPFITKKITVPYRTDTGMAKKEFTVYYTHFGPVVRAQDGKWVAVSPHAGPPARARRSAGRAPGPPT